MNIPNIIRHTAFEVMAVNRSIMFLGTGPSDPITGKHGKSRRMNTSCLISYEGKKYLIDIPKTNPDIKFDYLLITHLHSDAFGGFNKIKNKEFIFGLPESISHDVPKNGSWTRKILKVGSENRLGKLTIEPFRVEHDIIYGYPTFGYRFKFSDGYLIVYASDMVDIPKDSEKYFKKADMAIVDGAGWERNLITHFGIKPFLKMVKEKKWDLNKIYFVQIGRPVPDHEKAQKEITAINPSAKLAYDRQLVRF